METRFETGISTACLYPMETEESLALLLSLGYRRFEVFLNAFSELEKPFLTKLRSMAEAYGAVFCSVHPLTSSIETLLLFGDYPRRTEEGFRLYAKYAEAAAFLGGKYVVIHGQRRGTGTLSDREYWERFGELSRFSSQTGAIPAQENVRDHRSCDPAFLRGMREYLKEDVSFVLDVKQCRMSNCAVEETAAAMGDRLCHVHLSDSDRERPCLLPGMGKFDLPRFCLLLERMDFHGAIITEVYRRNFGEPRELEAARNYLEHQLQK